MRKKKNVNKKNNDEITVLEGTKIIFAVILEISIPVGVITLILTQFLNVSALLSVAIGIMAVIIIIFVFGLYKPASENKNNEDAEDFD